MPNAATRPVPEWLGPLTRARDDGLMPVARYVLIVLGVKDVHQPGALIVPASYRPEPSDDYRALVGLDVELFFGADTGFHRLRLVCEACVDAPIRRLVLLPETNPNFILLRRGDA